MADSQLYPHQTSYAGVPLSHRVSEMRPASLGTEDLLLGTLTYAIGTIQWLQATQPHDAVRMLRQALIGAPRERAILVSSANCQQELLRDLQPEQGPRELVLLTISSKRMSAMLRLLPSELDRATRVEHRLIIIALPSEVFSTRALAQWAEMLQAWLMRRSATLLIVSEGDPAGLAGQLSGRIPGLSGFAQLHRERGAPRLTVHYWHSRPRSEGAREILLVEQENGFQTLQLLAKAASEDEAAPDRNEVHAERSALEGSMADPLNWYVYPDRHQLLHRAATTRHATIVLGIGRSGEVDELAVALDSLRRASGSKLKLIVRETTPCLRYRDDQLLIAAGASLVVPFGTPPSRMFTLIDGIQGHVWQRQSPADITDSLDRSKPLPLRGRLTPRAFADAVRHMWAAKDFGELEHSLLHMRPLPGLGAESLIAESRFRRQGDIACLTAGGLYLFLFACRSETVEAALENIFPLSWQELFVSFERLAGLDALGSPLFLEEQFSPSMAKSSEPEPPAVKMLAPRAVRLELSKESHS